MPASRLLLADSPSLSLDDGEGGGRCGEQRGMYQASPTVEHPREAPPPAGKIELTDATKVYAAHGQAAAMQPTTSAGTPGNGADEAGSVVAFDGISLTVSEGELLCLLGRSGCGKSTLLHIIAGLEELSAGSLTVDGRPVDGPSHRRGLVFQQYALFPWLDVYRNVRFGLEARSTGMDGRVKDRAVRDLLALVGLGRVRGCAAPRAIGRHGAAGGHCAGTRQRAGDFALGRAVQCARRFHPHDNAG